MKTTKIVMSLFVMSLYMNTVQAQFTPTVFKPVEYHPQTTDHSTLERSFQRQEDRSSAAFQKYSELAQLIGEKRMKISNDRETLEWFSKNIDSKLKDVKSSLDVGDYAGARDRAVQAIGEVQSNTELIRRIQTYEEYIKVVQRIQERPDLTYQQKQDWINTYRYKFVPMRNTSGEVIGAYNWMEIGGPNNTRVIIP